jgi:hypothetical protein
MITEVITYENFNGEQDSRALNFHITEATLMENMGMRDKIATLADILGGPQRQLTTDEVQEIVNLVKWFMSISYGIKSPDGSSFDQDDPAGSGEVWRKFKNTPAYSAFIMSLFREPEKAVAFVVNVLPAELSKAATEAAENNPQMQAMLGKAGQQNRLAPGTRIINGVPEVPDAPVAPAQERHLATVPTADGEQEVDFDKMLADAQAADTGEPLEEVDPNEGKTPISKRDHDLMRASLRNKPGQFDKFMETRYVDASL